MNKLLSLLRYPIALTVMAVQLSAQSASASDGLIDDFSNPQLSSSGAPRINLDDTAAGGKTSVRHLIENGVLSVEGEISPPRGQPGWASTAILLNPDGSAYDASDFQGIRLLVRIQKGTLSLSANSAEITNFDYHSAVVTRQKGSDFHEVKIPFSSMKRAWSGNTELKLDTLLSVSLVAVGMQHGDFDYEVKEISFY